MKRVYLVLFAAASFVSVTTSFAQTGQVPKAYSGQQSRPATVNQPKPTGQIAPQVPGQPLGSLPQQAPATQPQPASNQVQNLGFEPVNANPQGQVPKVNTNQDQRTMPERYQPGQATRAQQMVVETEVDSRENVNVTVQPAGTTTTTTTGTQQNTNTTRPVQSTSKTQQTTPVQQTNTQPATAKP